MHEKEDDKEHARLLRQSMVHVQEASARLPAKVKAKKPTHRKRHKRR
jgi:hypothetical protein